jgi:outer membrane protein assembly factor BamA
MLKVVFTSENHQNLFKWTDWSVFNRYNYNWNSLFDDGFNWLNLFYDRDTEDHQPGVWGVVHPKPSNRRIDAGQLQSITLSYHFDNRDYKSSRVRFFQSVAVPHYLTSEGWLGHCSIEQTGFGSELRFSLFHLEVVHYRLLSDRRNLKFRLQTGFSPQGLPRQKLFYLGGLNTIRGYEFKTFEGENKVLFNIEFNQKYGADQSIVAGVFFDAGQAWYSDQYLGISKLATSIGLGVSLFLFVDQAQPSIIRLELAKPLQRGYGFQPTIRISQML